MLTGNIATVSIENGNSVQWQTEIASVIENCMSNESAIVWHSSVTCSSTNRREKGSMPYWSVKETK